MEFYCFVYNRSYLHKDLNFRSIFCNSGGEKFVRVELFRGLQTRVEKVQQPTIYM